MPKAHEHLPGALRLHPRDRRRWSKGAVLAHVSRKEGIPAVRLRLTEPGRDDMLGLPDPRQGVAAGLAGTAVGPA